VTDGRTLRRADKKSETKTGDFMQFLWEFHTVSWCYILLSACCTDFQFEEAYFLTKIGFFKVKM